MKTIYRVAQWLIGLINLAAAIFTIAQALKKSYVSEPLLLCGILLLCSTIFFYIHCIVADNKLRTLRILAHRGKVHTINYILYLDFLQNRFDSLQDNTPKTNGWSVDESEFSFHIYNNVNHRKRATVDYNHRFHLLGHDGKLDILILHTIGNLIREPQLVGAPDKEDTGVYCRFQGSHHSIVPEPCMSDVNNMNNQELDRVRSTLSEMNKKEWLDFHYRIEDEYNLEDDEVFVIYPKNYGKKFSGAASFHIQYEKPYVADIQLQKLPYGSIFESQMESVAHFESDNNGLNYSCCIKSIDVYNIYLIIIKKKPLL